MNEENKQLKPLQLLMHDFRNDIAKTLESAQLPMCVIVPILKEYLDECQKIERTQYEMIKTQYENNSNTENSTVKTDN